MCPQKSPNISSFLKSFLKSSRGGDLKAALFSAALSTIWLWTPLKPAGFRVPMDQVSALFFQHNTKSSASCSHTPLSLFIPSSFVENLVWIWLTQCTWLKTQTRTNGLTWTNKDVTMKSIDLTLSKRVDILSMKLLLFPVTVLSRNTWMIHNTDQHWEVCSGPDSVPRDHFVLLGADLLC